MDDNTKLQPYTKEMIEELKAEYLKSPTRETIEVLAKKFDRNVRSITAKLSREGVYVKLPYRTKQGEVPHTKEDLVDLIAELMGEFPEALEGLEKAPKLVLRKLAQALDENALERFKG